jgi:hypothetical protein
VLAGRWRPDPGAPVIVRELVSRREARAARKKLKTLRGSKWKNVPAADRLVLQAFADARMTLANEIRVAVLAVLIVAAAGAAIAYGVTELGPTMRAGTGAGTHGWFTAHRFGCEIRGCHWGGSFESAGRHVILRNVGYADADPAMRAGSVVAALFPGGGDLVYAPRGSSGWVAPAVFLLLGVAVVAPVLWYGVVRNVRRSLRIRGMRAMAGPIGSPAAGEPGR